MNAAARLVHQGVLSRHLVLTHIMSRKQVSILLLTLAILFSALSIIYVTQATRVMHAAYQRTLLEQNRYTSERGQLLLERSTWEMQARIQQIAEGQLGMITPDHKSVVIVRE